MTPSVPGQEVLTANPTRIGDVVPGPVAPVVLVPDYRLDLASVSGANSAASTLTPAPSGIANDANLQATAGVAGIGSNSLQVASLAASVSDPLPALPDAPPAAPAKRETPTIVPVKRPNLATDAATPVAVAPVAMIAVTAMPRNSDVSTASSALQSLAFADSAASTVLLAAILADPLGVDAPLKMPGPTAPISIASNYSATPAFADVIESINLDARLPGTFRDLAPSFDFVSLPQSAAPGDAPAALVSPEPSASALANAPIARPAEVVDAAEDLAAQAAIEGFDVVVHAPQSWSGAALNELTEALRATGYSIRSPVRVRFKISRDNVRYFHASDAEAAAALAAAFGARVRDFTASGAAPSRRTPGAAFGARVRDFTHSTSGKWQSLNCSVRRARA